MKSKKIVAALVLTVTGLAGFAIAHSWPEQASTAVQQEQWPRLSGSEVGYVAQITTDNVLSVEVRDQLYQVTVPALEAPPAPIDRTALHNLLIGRVIALDVLKQRDQKVTADVLIDGRPMIDQLRMLAQSAPSQ